MHTIRLRGTWPLEAVSTQPQQLCYHRKFHRPSGLAPGQVVRLVIRWLGDAPPATADWVMQLNEHPLSFENSSEPAIASARVEQALSPFNQLRLCLTAATTQSSAPALADLAEVCLEIDD